MVEEADEDNWSTCADGASFAPEEEHGQVAASVRSVSDATEGHKRSNPRWQHEKQQTSSVASSSSVTSFVKNYRVARSKKERQSAKLITAGAFDSGPFPARYVGGRPSALVLNSKPTAASSSSSSIAASSSRSFLSSTIVLPRINQVDPGFPLSFHAIIHTAYRKSKTAASGDIGSEEGSLQANITMPAA